MKILFILLFGLVLGSQGETGKFEDEVEPSDDEFEEDNHNNNENIGAEMKEMGLADPAKKPVSKKTAKKKKPAKMKKPFKIPDFEGILPDKCPAKYRFCRSKTTCYSVGLHKTVCNARRLCFCSMCPKNTQRFCGFLDRKTMTSNSYTLVCRCRSMSTPKQKLIPHTKAKPKPKRKPKLNIS